MADHPEPNPSPVEPPGPTGSPCRHLRSNGKYVFSDGVAKNPNEGYDTSIYWCLKTMKGFGPDDDFATLADCRDSARSCYEPL